MRSFNMGGPGGTDDPWFRVGSIDVTTTVFVIGVGLLSMIVWAIEGTGRAISKYLWLVSRDIGEVTGGSVLSGQIWRLITWPIPNEPDFWTLILFAVFFMLGTQLERMMGRNTFAIYLAVLAVVPAVMVTLWELVTGDNGGVQGLRFLEIGVLVGFAAHHPRARFWPGIPAWGIAAGIVALEFLQNLGNRDSWGNVMLFSVVAVALLAIRSFGFADELEWIPRLPVPASWGVATAAATRTPRRQNRKRAALRVVPPPDPVQLQREEAEIDALLDQVNSEGLDSLTRAQRKQLEEHSRRLRKRNDDT